MDPEQLARLEDLTDRYGKYQPCGAGLGAVWTGGLLAVLAGMIAHWGLPESARVEALPPVYWNYLKSHLAIPGWLVLAAFAVPFLGWLGGLALQPWADRSYGIVECSDWGGIPKQQFTRFPVGLAFSALLVMPWRGWSSPTTSMWQSTLGILALVGWVWFASRNSRDRLTWLTVIFTYFPAIHFLDCWSHKLIPSELVSFEIWFPTAPAAVLIISGAWRFLQFLKVRRELDTFQVADQ